MPADSVRALTVSELNEYARRILAGDPLLRNVEVSGEISGYKHHYSGHRYFTLKDAQARVQCVMFRQSAMGLDFTPADGMKVVVRGSASVFVRDGSYQLYVTQMRRSGLGDLYEQFEKLKAKLLAEGLFDPARKREIPFLPRKIGIVTSEMGAAVHDMIRVAPAQSQHRNSRGPLRGSGRVRRAGNRARHSPIERKRRMRRLIGRARRRLH